MLEPVYFLPKL